MIEAARNAVRAGKARRDWYTTLRRRPGSAHCNERSARTREPEHGPGPSSIQLWSVRIRRSRRPVRPRFLHLAWSFSIVAYCGNALRSPCSRPPQFRAEQRLAACGRPRDGDLNHAFGRLPSTSQRGAAPDRADRRVAVTRRVSVTPGMKNSRPTFGFATMFLNVSSGCYRPRESAASGRRHLKNRGGRRAA